MVIPLSLGAVTLGLSWWLTGRLCSPASRLYLLDLPNERSLHVSPTPRTGGLAIMGGLIMGLGVWLIVEWLFGPVVVSPPLLGRETHSGIHFWTIGSAVVLSLVSFWDDHYGLSPGTRFGMQALMTAGIILVGHLTLNTIPVPFGLALSLGWLSVPFTFLFIMWMTNLYNFMDGMDGFAGGMTVAGFAFLGLVFWYQGHTSIGLLSFLVVVAAAGFLVFNFPPARIFMGDVGSVPLGFLAGVLSVMGVRDGVFDIWVPVLIFSPFIVDATVTLIRRLVRRENVWKAHREHYYQRLVLSGWGHRKTVLGEYVLMLACGGSALLYSALSDQWKLILLVGWAAVYSFLAISIHSVESSHGLRCQTAR